MNRVGDVPGAIAGAILTSSTGLHSFLGGSSLQAGLVAARVASSFE